MGMTAAELEDRMSGEEFAEHWLDYHLIEVEPERDDVRTAALMEVVAAAHGGKLSRNQAYNSLCMNGERQRPQEMTEAQMKGALRMLG